MIGTMGASRASVFRKRPFPPTLSGSGVIPRHQRVAVRAGACERLALPGRGGLSRLLWPLRAAERVGPGQQFGSVQ